MFLNDVVDDLREKLVKHRLAPRKFLWQTILKQIAKQSSFDGAYATIIEKMISEFLAPQDDATIISFWKETEVGMGHEDEAELYLADGLRMDVEVEVMEQLTHMAHYEATGKWPKLRRSLDEREPDWD